MSNYSFYLHNIMNIQYIILGVIFVVLLYIFYIYFYQRKNIIDNIDLTSGPKIIDSTLLKARGFRCAYGGWVYINSWNNSGEKVLFTRNPEKFELFLDATSPTLKCRINTPSTGTDPNSETIILTTNFPIQKWVYVIISFDNQILDCYLDGKLITSKQLKNTVDQNGDFILGRSNAGDIYMARVHGWDTPIDPQTAWSTYLDGNGMSASSLPNYNIQMSILKDNVEKTQFKLL